MLVSIQTQYRATRYLRLPQLDSVNDVRGASRIVSPPLDKFLQTTTVINTQAFGAPQIAVKPPGQLSPPIVTNANVINPKSIVKLMPGSFTTWNDADRSANIVLSNAFLTATQNGGGDCAVRAVAAKTAGSWYCEYHFDQAVGGDTGAGFANAAAVLADLGNVAANGIIQFLGGNVYHNGTRIGPNNPIATGNILRAAYNAGTKRGWLAVNGDPWCVVFGGSQDPATGAGGFDLSVIAGSGGLFPCFCGGGGGAACTANFGATAFAYPAPSGFNGWTP